ncbi:hypothetical protein LINPERHAP1_LOCUS1431 [Linum perenne]
MVGTYFVKRSDGKLEMEDWLILSGIVGYLT